MEIAQYLKQKQPFVYKTFSYALTNDKLAHAYIVSGENGTPLKQTAIFLAKSILCKNPNPLADLECPICRRVDQGEYPDFVYIDGEESSIKKDMVASVVTLFQQTPLEAKGIMVYVIHLVENMTPEAANGLLKFLEEPTPYSYAILTTQNDEKVLPTILSRCERLKLLLTSREEVLQEALALGVALEDAELLTPFFNEGSLVEAEAKKEEYQAMKDGFLELLDSLSKSDSTVRFVCEKTLVPLLNTKQKSRFFFDLLSYALKDAVNVARGNSPKLSCYAKIMADAAKKLPHLEQVLVEVMALRQEIELNLSITLLLNHLSVLLTSKEHPHGQ